MSHGQRDDARFNTSHATVQHFSRSFRPHGPAGIDFGPFSSIPHHTSIPQTITLLVTSSMLFGLGVALIYLTALSYIKRLKQQVPTPTFFILAILSGVNLLALCTAHMAVIRPRLKFGIAQTSDYWRKNVYDFYNVDQLPLLPEWASRPSEPFQAAQIISQLENINLAVSNLAILLRIQALFPEEPRLQQVARILLILCGASFFLSIGLQLPGDLYDAGYNVPLIGQTRDWIIKRRNIGLMLYHNAYLSGWLQFIVNVFATWLLITTWRNSRRFTSGFDTDRRSRKNDPLLRLQILVYAGVLLGLSQASWYIFYTRLTIRERESSSIDYVLCRFLFHASSALYPIASYITIHWNTPSGDDYCVDLVDIQGMQDHEIPLDDLGSNPNGSLGPSSLLAPSSETPDEEETNSTFESG